MTDKTDAAYQAAVEALRIELPGLAPQLAQAAMAELDSPQASPRVEPLLQDIARLRGEEELAAKHGAVMLAQDKREVRETKVIELAAVIERERLCAAWDDIDRRAEILDALKGAALRVGKAAAIAALGAL